MALLLSLCISCGMCCAAAFALLPGQLLRLLGLVQLNFLTVHPFCSFANIRTVTPNKERQTTHTHSSFLVHELITHFSTGINTQILLLSLRRALDRIAVFLKAKKQMENQDFQG